MEEEAEEVLAAASEEEEEAVVVAEVAAVDTVSLASSALHLSLGYEYAPPEQVVEVAEFSHGCEGMVVCDGVGCSVPLSMGSDYLEDENTLGEVDDQFGPMSRPGIAIQPDEGEMAESFEAGTQVIYKLLLILS